MAAPAPAPSEDWLVVTDPTTLDAVIERLMVAERYAIDTEFHRERTYWPRVALVQVAWPAGAPGPAGVALIDALRVDIAPLAAVLAGPATMVVHAAEQDLEVLDRACGSRPCSLFDTQVAAGFVGHGSASLASLSSTYLGLEVAKGHRLTDWSQRPLTDAQLAYAAADVRHLLELADAITAALEHLGRLGWAGEECEVLRARPVGPGDPRRAWWKLRDARQLRGTGRGVAQEVAAWRERRAQAMDQPVRSVLPDLALQSIAHQPPSGAAALARVRGLDGRYLRGDAANGLLEAVERGRRLPPGELLLPPADEVPRHMRPAVALAMAWVSQLALDKQVDAALLATRGDLAAFLRRDPGARLARGWRSAMVGGPLRALVEGQAALAFNRGGGLALEERSGIALAPAGDSD